MPPLDAAVVVAAVRDYVARALTPTKIQISDMALNIAEVQVKLASHMEAMDNRPIPKDGEPGRDAAQLEIVSAIDATKSYPRGTYATHNNGLWRAYEATEGMRGWECLVAGLAEIEVTFAHEREFQVSHTLSNGKKTCQTFEIPVSIYRGVFVEGREYHRGDAVSWGAHQWHCNEPTTEKPIEGGKAWTLSVKRGRDGKDGRDLTVKGKP